jgi:hypothetical protein
MQWGSCVPTFHYCGSVQVTVGSRAQKGIRLLGFEADLVQGSQHPPVGSLPVMATKQLSLATPTSPRPCLGDWELAQWPRHSQARPSGSCLCYKTGGPAAFSEMVTVGYLSSGLWPSPIYRAVKALGAWLEEGGHMPVPSATNKVAGVVWESRRRGTILGSHPPCLVPSHPESHGGQTDPDIMLSMSVPLPPLSPTFRDSLFR